MDNVTWPEDSDRALTRPLKVRGWDTRPRDSHVTHTELLKVRGCDIWPKNDYRIHTIVDGRKKHDRNKEWEEEKKDLTSANIDFLRVCWGSGHPLRHLTLVAWRWTHERTHIYLGFEGGKFKKRHLVYTVASLDGVSGRSQQTKWFIEK